MHHLHLIELMAIGLGLAMVFGLLAQRLRMPPLVGYLLAGVVIGPATPGFDGDLELAHQLSEIGVMLLMFGVGLHFSLEDLLRVRRIAVPGALVQIAAATGMGMVPALLWGWPWGQALVFGLCLSVASTVVLLKALESRHWLGTSPGNIAVGWLVVEDLVMVLVLVLLPPLAAVLGGAAPAPGATALPLWQTVLLTLFKVSAFIALMLGAGRRLLPWLLMWVARTGSRELFILTTVVLAISVAYLAGQVFGVSFALGAFFAGMVLRESEFSHQAAEETLPLRDAFAVLFFVAVGMLFDPAILLKAPDQVLVVVAVIMLGKTLAAAALVLLMRYPLRTALVVSVSLAQIGEFSFILAGLAMNLKLLTPAGQNLILAGALVSIALNSVLFALVEPLQQQLTRRFHWAQWLEQRPDPLAALPDSVAQEYLTDVVIVAGYGRVGQLLVPELLAQQVHVVVIDHNREQVNALRESGVATVWGEIHEARALIQAHVQRARALVVTFDDPVRVSRMLDLTAQLNPDLAIVLQGQAADAERLWADPRVQVWTAEQALAQSLQHSVGQLLAAPVTARHEGPGHALH